MNYSDSIAGALANNCKDHEKADDYTWSASDVVRISFNGTDISVIGTGVAVEGSKATITAAGNYNLSGTLTDGQIIVNAGDSDIVRLLLDGVTMRYSAGAPIDIRNAKKVIIVLTEQTQNTVTDAVTYAFDNSDEDEPNAAVFSKCDLTICGSGSLTVNANYNDGIASKDGLVLKDAAINVSSADDGIRGRDYIIVNDARIIVNAVGDGLKSDNDEDAARGYILINGGYLKVIASGDGFDINGSITMTDGVVIIDGPTARDNGALDYDRYFKISGGYLVVAGSSGMAMAPGTTSTQNSVLLNFYSTIPAGTLFHLESSDGQEIVSFAPVKNYQSVAFSSDKLLKGTTYNVYVDGSYSGTIKDGLYEDGTYSPGTKRGSFTISSVVTRLSVN